MIYKTKAELTVDTRAKTLIIQFEGKRIALVAGGSHSSDAYITLNERPDLHPTEAGALVRWLVQNLYHRKQVKKLARETPNGG